MTQISWDEVVAHALAKPGAWADEPWGHGDQVVKIGKKIFLFAGSGDVDPPRVTVRCEPDDVQPWRDRYPASIGPAPYMGTRPWNKVLLDGSIPDDDVLTMLDESYDSVVARIPKRDRPPGWEPSR
jgi:predicted DNA-binding protein (MmcQ/YjbR family)